MSAVRQVTLGTRDARNAGGRSRRSPRRPLLARGRAPAPSLRFRWLRSRRRACAAVCPMMCGTKNPSERLAVMAWDFSTDPEYQAKLDWARDFVREEIWPLETLVRELDQGALDRAYAPLQAEVKRQGLWAAHLPPELGGQGYGQVKLGLLHEILGSTPFAPNAFGCQAPDSGNSEILALAGTPEQKERWLEPLLAGDIKSAFSMTEPHTAGGGPDAACRPGGARRRRVRHQRPQVVLLQRVDRRLPDPHGRDRPRRARPPAGVDVHRPRRHAGREHPARRADDGAPAGELRQARRARRDPLRGRPASRRCAAGRRGRGLPHRPAPARPGSHPPLHALARASPSARSTCSASAAWSATPTAGLLAEKQTVQNWIADSAAQMQAARLMTLHAAWVMDTRGRRRRADRHLADQVLWRAGAARRHRPRAADPRQPRLLDRHAAGGDVPLRARGALLRRPRRGPPPVGGAPDPARLPGAGGRRADRALPTRREEARAKFAELLEAVTAND